MKNRFSGKVLLLIVGILVTLSLFHLNERHKEQTQKKLYRTDLEVNLAFVLYDEYDNPIELQSISDKLIFVFTPLTCTSCVIEQLGEIERYSADFENLDVVLLGYFDNRRDLRRFKVNNNLSNVTYYRTNDEILLNRVSSISSIPYFLKIHDNRVVLFRETTRNRNETYTFLERYYRGLSLEHRYLFHLSIK
jgi:hypothetical protein